MKPAQYGPGGSGLVQAPTSSSHEGRSADRAADRARDLRENLGRSRQHGLALRINPRQARLSRLRRNVGFAARAHDIPRPGFRPDWCVMLTLTYRPGSDWAPSDISRYFHHLRDWCRKRGLSCRYVWVAELQKRGAVHYHVALWLPEGVRPPKPDVKGWWPHGMANRVVARSAPAYLMKYLSKGSGGQSLPANCRGYGVAGLEHQMRRARRWLRYPAFVQARADIHDEWTPAYGGGWIDPDGVVIPSEYERTWLGVSFGLLRVCFHGRPFETAGPFSWIAK